MRFKIILFSLFPLLIACGSIQQYKTVEQPTHSVLRTYTGGTILRVVKEESLPNAFGGADIHGGRRPQGSIELKYLGLTPEKLVRLRVLSTDITTNEDWRRRLGKKGNFAATKDAVDFLHDPSQPFDMEGVRVVFLRADSSSLQYRLIGAAPSQR